MFKTALNIEISVIEIYLYFGACHLLFFKNSKCLVYRRTLINNHQL